MCVVVEWCWSCAGFRGVELAESTTRNRQLYKSQRIVALKMAGEGPVLARSVCGRGRIRGRLRFHGPERRGTTVFGGPCRVIRLEALCLNLPGISALCGEVGRLRSHRRVPKLGQRVSVETWSAIQGKRLLGRTLSNFVLTEYS